MKKPKTRFNFKVRIEMKNKASLPFVRFEEILFCFWL